MVIVIIFATVTASRDGTTIRSHGQLSPYDDDASNVIVIIVVVVVNTVVNKHLYPRFYNTERRNSCTRTTAVGTQLYDQS